MLIVFCDFFQTQVTHPVQCDKFYCKIAKFDRSFYHLFDCKIVAKRTEVPFCVLKPSIGTARNRIKAIQILISVQVNDKILVEGLRISGTIWRK